MVDSYSRRNSQDLVLEILNDKQEANQTSCSNKKNDGSVSEQMINFTKLINQLFNAKVVIEKMPESSGRNKKSEKSQNRSQLDSVKRYCPKCKTTKVDHRNKSIIKYCSKCKTTMKYMCSKCNNKIYKGIRNLMEHSDKCGQEDSRSKRFNGSEFLVEQAAIDFSKEVIRYCPTCKKVATKCCKWKKQACRKCKSQLLYQCSKCQCRYNTYDKLSDHMKLKCYPSVYKCNQCDYTHAKNKGIRRHINNVHSDKKSKCKKCGTELKSGDSFKNHVKRCGVNLKLYCDHCEMKTKFKHYLIYHLKTKHGESLDTKATTSFDTCF